MVGRRLSHQLKQGRLRWIGRPLYEGLIDLQLARIAWKERGLRFENTPLVTGKLTAVVKTFERPETVKRLLDSLFRLYPGMRVIVVDDSRVPVTDPRVRMIRLPYDSGVSLGRQRALEAVETPYVLLLDDDFVFYRETVLEPALALMERERRIDIMGGEVVNLPSMRVNDYRGAGLYPTEAVSLIPPGSRIAGLEVYDKVPNFYIARTASLRMVGWDPRIKRLDHADFFTRAKGVLVTVLNPGFKVLHAQTPFREGYMQKRRDTRADQLILRHKYYRR